MHGWAGGSDASVQFSVPSFLIRCKLYLKLKAVFLMPENLWKCSQQHWSFIKLKFNELFLCLRAESLSLCCRQWGEALAAAMTIRLSSLLTSPPNEPRWASEHQKQERVIGYSHLHRHSITSHFPAWMYSDSPCIHQHPSISISRNIFNVKNTSEWNK